MAPAYARFVFIRGVSIGVLYIARFSEGVHVLYAFEKRTGKTPKQDVALSRKGRSRSVLKVTVPRRPSTFSFAPSLASRNLE